MRRLCSILLVLVASALFRVSTTQAQSRRLDGRARRPPPPTAAARSEPLQHLFTAKLGFGMSFGGEEPLSYNVAAGDGITLLAGVALTPLWTSWLALGAGVDIGFKYAATQSIGGGYDLSRVPLTLPVHALIRIGDAMFVRVAAGPHLEVGVQLSPTGRREAMDIGFHDALGFMAEGGIFFRVKHFAVDASVRYTGLRYEGETDPAADADASNIGIFFGIDYVL